MASIEQIELLLKPFQGKLEIMNNNIINLQTAVSSTLSIKKEIGRKFASIDQELAAKDKKIEFMERKLREKNIIIFGLEETNQENLIIKTIVFFQNVLHLEDIAVNNIEEVRRLGRPHSEKIRPILVEFISKKTKKQIYENIHYLRGGRIRIAEDYSQEVVQERKALIPHMKNAKGKGLNAFLKFNKLIINGVPYSSRELDLNTEEDSADIPSEEEVFQTLSHKDKGNSGRRRSISLQNIQETIDIEAGYNKEQLFAHLPAKEDQNTNKRNRDQVSSEDSPIQLNQYKKQTKPYTTNTTKKNDKGTLDSFLGSR